MEAELDTFKLHDNLLSLRVEKFKAGLARLLPSRRPPTRSKLIKTCDEVEEDRDNIYHRNDTDSTCSTESTSTKKSENENLLDNSAAQQTEAAITEVAASGPQTPPASISLSQLNDTLSQKESMNFNSNKRNSKSRWSFHNTRSKLKNPVEMDNDFPKAKSELESVLQRVLRSKGESFSSKMQQNDTTNKDIEIPPKIIEPLIYPRRVNFVTAESLQETKQRLRHLVDFKGFNSQIEVTNNNINSSIGVSKIVELDDCICNNIQEESDKNNSTTTETTDLMSNGSPMNLGINSSTINTAYKSDNLCGLCDFEPTSDLDLEKAIFSDVQPAPETNLSTESGVCQSTELESVSTSMLCEHSAKITGYHNDSPMQKVETSSLMPKGSDIFELLRQVEKQVADKTADMVKPTMESADKMCTSGIDTWHRRKTPRNDYSITPARVINDSWIRVTQTLSDPYKLDTSALSTTSIANTTSLSTIPFKTRAWDSEEKPKVMKGRVLEALESLRQSSSSNDFEPNTQLFRRSNDSQEMNNLVIKQHSTAYDNVKPVVSQFSKTYVTSQFCENLSSLHASDQLMNTPVNQHVVQGLPLVENETAVSTSDIEVPDKIKEHLAADELGEMETVKIDENAPPTNNYRHKRRSVSVSPKMLDVNSTYFKFGNYDEEIEDCNEIHSQLKRRNSFNAPNSNLTSHTWPGDNFSSASGLQKKADIPKSSGSTTSENGSVVTISSMKLGFNFIRQTSKSISDENEPNTSTTGSSTELDFGKDVSVITDKISRKWSDENNPLKSPDETVLEKSHFIPPRIEEDKGKIITNSTHVDAEHARTTSMAVNVLQDIRPEDTIAAAKKFTTELLHLNDKKIESIPLPFIIGAQDSNQLMQHQDIRHSRQKPDKAQLADNHHCSSITKHKEYQHEHRTPDSFTSKSSNSRAKTKCKPVTIIHHGVRLQDKGLADSRRFPNFPAASTPKSEFADRKSQIRTSKPMSSSTETKKNHHLMGIGGGSLRKKLSTTTGSSAGREGLFDTGRNSWLNLPKEYKSTTSNNIAKQNTGDTTSSDSDNKHTPRTLHHSSRLPTPYNSKKSRRVEPLTIVDHTGTEATHLGPRVRDRVTSVSHRDVSNQEDKTNHHRSHRKQSSKPPTTISKKSGLRLTDHQGSYRATPYTQIRSASIADTIRPSKLSLTRNTLNSSQGSRSKFDFKYPVLQTEERSKQRAARMLQRAASREPLIRRGHISPSENITLSSDKCVSEVNTNNKVKTSQKVTSARTLQTEATSRKDPSKSRSNRNTKDGSILSRAIRPMQ